MSRLVILNQMAGPLFIDLTRDLSSFFTDGCVLYTSHPDSFSSFSLHYPNVKLIKSPNYNRKSLYKRVYSWFNYLVFSSFFIILSKKNDIFLLSTNPPFLGIWFWVLSKISKSPYLIVVYDIYPDVMVSSGLLKNSSLTVKVWNYFNEKAYKNASFLVTISNGLAHRLSEVHPHLHSKIKVIYPWADIDVIKPICSNQNQLYHKFNPDGKKVILYAGNMGISHDIDSIVKAAYLLRHQEKFHFLFVGGGDAFQKIINFRKNKKLTNISIYNYQSLHLLPHLLSLSAVSLVALEDDRQDLMIPSKLFSYLASGSAVIGICSSGSEVQNIIENNKCGVCVNPGHPKELAKVLIDLLNNDSKLSEFGTNARLAATNKYSKQLGVSKFIENFYRYGLIK